LVGKQRRRYWQAAGRSELFAARLTLSQARAKPADLAAMIGFIFGNVEPRPVSIEIGRNSQRRFEPRIITLRKRGQSSSRIR
jgi:hypothetical protein